MLRVLSTLVVLLMVLASPAAVARDGALLTGRVGDRATASPALVLGWQPPVAGRRALSAVALETGSGRVALADTRGITLVEPGGTVSASISRPNVTALAFAPDAALLVGTTQGLFAAEAGGSLTDRSPSPGDEARNIVRIAACGSAVAVATGRGVHGSTDGHTWQSAPGTLGREPVSAVTVSCHPGGAELRAVAGADVWRASIDGATGEIGDVAPLGGLDPGIRARAVDVRLADDGSEDVLAPDVLASRVAGSAAWAITRPVLAPGAVAIRIFAAAGRRWIATDRGLFGEDSRGSWERLPPGAVFAAVADLAGDAAHIFAATQQGLLGGHLEPSPGLRTAARVDAARALEFAVRREPAVQEIFAAALDHLALQPEAIRDLRRGLARRGLLPRLDLRIERDRVWERDLDDDEAFVSGDLRRLRDQHRGSQHAVTALVQFSWELGDLAYPPDTVDLSKEARAVTQLRDDVLDEITHLYFERRRVLLDLDELGPGQDGLEAARLRLRADELAAGLDAWTGGWFGQRLAALAR